MAVDITDIHGRMAALSASTVNNQTGTSYTLTLDDANSIVTLTNGSAITVTIPPNSSVKFANGTRIRLVQLGAGQVTVAAGSGVTLRAAPTAKVTAQYGTVEVSKIATDTWVLSGAIAAS